jgi:hypothetical protein
MHFNIMILCLLVVLTRCIDDKMTSTLLKFILIASTKFAVSEEMASFETSLDGNSHSVSGAREVLVKNEYDFNLDVYYDDLGDGFLLVINCL